MRLIVSANYHVSSDDIAWYTATLEAATVTEAVRAFVADHAIPADKIGYVKIKAADTIGKKPSRAVMNWEKDPYAEASDGYLSNMAASWTEHKQELAYQPEYCATVALEIACPACGAVYVAREYIGKYGAYVRCPGCHKSMGRYTKKFDKAYRGIARVCGTPLESRVNANGCAYAGCPTCSPDGDYERKPIGALIGYRDR